jgi:hypothetical protein
MEPCHHHLDSIMSANDGEVGNDSCSNGGLDTGDSSHVGCDNDSHQ